MNRLGTACLCVAGLVLSTVVFASTAFASDAVVAYAASRNLVIAAQSAKTTAFNAATGATVWTSDGVDAPRVCVIGPDRALVLDSFNSDAILISLADGNSRRFAVAATPIAGAFVDGDAFVLSRDGRRLQRLGVDGVADEVETPQDSAFLAIANGRLYVYGRIRGVLEELEPRPLRMTRRALIAAFASDMEVDSHAIYLLYPRAGRMSIVSLRDFSSASQPVGAVPVDAAIEGGANAISAGNLVVADPSSKRIWRSERSQSFTAAAGRGFVRGLLGLGLYHPTSREFPTGIDRISVDRYARLAYDSTTGSLFTFDGKKPRLLMRDLTPASYAATPNGVAIWDRAADRIVFRK